MKNGQKIYHCSSLGIVDGFPSYSKPTEYTLRFNYLTIQPKTGHWNNLPYGMDVARAWNGIAKESLFDGIFKEGDLLYLDGLIPNEDEHEYGQTANGLIVSVLNRNRTIQLEITKREF